MPQFDCFSVSINNLYMNLTIMTFEQRRTTQKTRSKTVGRPPENRNTNIFKSYILGWLRFTFRLPQQTPETRQNLYLITQKWKWDSRANKLCTIFIVLEILLRYWSSMSLKCRWISVYCTITMIHKGHK